MSAGDCPVTGRCGRGLKRSALIAPWIRSACRYRLVDPADNPVEYDGAMACDYQGSDDTFTTEPNFCSGITCAAGYGGYVEYLEGPEPGSSVVLSGCQAMLCPVEPSNPDPSGRDDSSCEGLVTTETCEVYCEPGYYIANADAGGATGIKVCEPEAVEVARFVNMPICQACAAMQGAMRGAARQLCHTVD